MLTSISDFRVATFWECSAAHCVAYTGDVLLRGIGCYPARNHRRGVLIQSYTYELTYSNGKGELGADAAGTLGFR